MLKFAARWLTLYYLELLNCQQRTETAINSTISHQHHLFIWMIREDFFKQTCRLNEIMVNYNGVQLHITNIQVSHVLIVLTAFSQEEELDRQRVL